MRIGAQYVKFEGFWDALEAVSSSLESLEAVWTRMQPIVGQKRPRKPRTTRDFGKKRGQCDSERLWKIVWCTLNRVVYGRIVYKMDVIG